jgi:hypothetical protein
MPEPVEVRYHVLPDSARPYLLARVRWPDVAQAISAGCPDWLDDVGLFDLPDDPSSVPVTLAQATAIAAGWGAHLPSETTVRGTGPALVRRMPANWSDLTPAEIRAWSLESVIGRRARHGRSRTGVKSSRASSPPGHRGSPVHVNGHTPTPLVAEPERWPAPSPSDPSGHDNTGDPAIASLPDSVMPETAGVVEPKAPALPAVFSRMGPRSSSPRPSRIPRTPRPTPTVPGKLGRGASSPSPVDPDLVDAATRHSDNGVDADLGGAATNGNGGRPTESKV